MNSSSCVWILFEVYVVAFGGSKERCRRIAEKFIDSPTKLCGEHPWVPYAAKLYELGHWSDEWFDLINHERMSQFRVVYVMC